MNALKLWNIQDDPQKLVEFVVDLADQYDNDKITLEEFNKYSDFAHYYMLKCDLDLHARELYKKYGVRL